MATYTRPHITRAADLDPTWHVIDAEGKTLGRLATEIATLLQGKHKPTYVSYMNTGDFVIVVNAEKVRVTGKKLEQKIYYRHSGYHGGLTERTLGQTLERTPTRAVQHAVKGMLPKNALGRKMLGRLKLYAGPDHPHDAQVNRRPKKTKADRDEPEDGSAPAQAAAEAAAVASAAPEEPAVAEAESPAIEEAVVEAESAAAEDAVVEAESPTEEEAVAIAESAAAEDAVVEAESPTEEEAVAMAEGPAVEEEPAAEAETPAAEEAAEEAESEHDEEPADDSKSRPPSKSTSRAKGKRSGSKAPATEGE